MKKINVVCGVIVKDNKYLITQRGDSKNINKWETRGSNILTPNTTTDQIEMGS